MGREVAAEKGQSKCAMEVADIDSLVAAQEARGQTGWPMEIDQGRLNFERGLEGW